MSDERVRDGAIRKTIEDFTGGYNLFSDPCKISEKEFLEFENLIINKPGRFLNAQKRSGFERWNFNRSFSTEPINSLFQAVWNTRDLNDMVIIKTTSSLEYCFGNSTEFTSIATGLSSGKVKFLMFQDRVYICHLGEGEDTNKVYDGTNYLDIGCPPCMQNQILSLSTVASTVLGTGIYHYLIVFLYDGNMESGVILRHTDSNTDVNSIAGTNISREEMYTAHISNSTQKKINISAIPIGNERVTARVIYRTKSDGDAFYYLTTISDNNTSVLLNDDTPDTDLGDEYNGGNGFVNIIKPYKSKYQVIHQRRLWQANIREDQYEAIDTSLILLASQAGSSHISSDAARAAIYTYKFAKDIRVIKGKVFSGTTGIVKPPYTGIFGALSGTRSVTTTPTHTEVYLSEIPIDDFCQRTAIFRNCCQFISGISVAGSVLTITVGTGWVFKEGETVTITGVAGFTSNPNGTYVINTVTSTTFKITHNTTSGTYTAASGVVQGSNFYICGFTRSGAFTDGYADSYMAGLDFNVLTSTGNKPYKSSVISSEADQPDIFPPGNFMSIGQDNGQQIMGIFSDDRRLIVFKENSIYEIDTTYQDTSFARARRIVRDIGAKSGDTIVQISPSEFIFLANDNYFYYWPGSGKPKPISLKIQTIIDELEYENIDGCYYPNLQWVIFTYSTLEIKGNVLIYDLSVADATGAGTWYHFTKNTADLNLCAPIVTKDRELLFGCQSEGFIFKYGQEPHDHLITDGTTRFDGVPIKIKIKTKLFKDYITVKKIFAKIYSNGLGNDEALSFFYGKEPNDIEYEKKSSVDVGLNIEEHKVNISGREFYLRLENEDEIDLSIKELGFEYEPAHKAGEV